MEFDNRIDLITNLIKPNGVYAEIGVFKGDFSKQIIDCLSPHKLILIDLFSGNVFSGNQDGNNLIWANLDDEYIRLSNLYNNNPNIEVIKGNSYSILHKYNDETFDMIYIDVDHSYFGCLRDLQIALKKCKTGGYICGHDYEMNMKKANHIYNFGVRQAVDEFCFEHKLQICAKGLDGCVSFAIKKV